MYMRTIKGQEVNKKEISIVHFIKQAIKPYTIFFNDMSIHNINDHGSPFIPFLYYLWIAMYSRENSLHCYLTRSWG